jgi:hypothetical protein
MADARTRFVRIRSWAAGLFAAGYVVALTSFWVAGAAAYSRSGHGLSRLLGLAYFPILLLPVIGKGTVEGLKVHGLIWLWWFGVQMILGVAAICLYPYERPRRAAQVAGALDWLESTSRGTGAVDHAVLGLGASALAPAGLGEDERAAALLAEIEATPGARANWGYAIHLPTMVRSALGIGDRELAERLVDGVEPRYPYAEQALVAANAALAEARGDLQAADAYAEAADRWERFGVVPEQAFALLGQGRCLVGLARPTEAVHVLDQAREIFDSLGAEPALGETDALLQEAISLSS